jgi:hypothetical protein
MPDLGMVGADTSLERHALHFVERVEVAATDYLGGEFFDIRTFHPDSERLRSLLFK